MSEKPHIPIPMAIDHTWKGSVFWDDGRNIVAAF
jgi:hypothetical protein